MLVNRVFRDCRERHVRSASSKYTRCCVRELVEEGSEDDRLHNGRSLLND